MHGSPPANSAAFIHFADERPTITSGARLRFDELERRRMIPKASTRELLAWVLRRRKRMRVRGVSMEPTLRDGDVVLIDRFAYKTNGPVDGDVVVAIHPQQPELEIIKRVEFSDENGVYLRSDNAGEKDVADSRRFGMVSYELIIGRVTATAVASR